MRNGAVLIRYQNLEAQVLQVVISRLVGNLRGVGHIDIGPAGHRVVLAELDPRVVGVPLEPLVVGVAVAVQIFDICFQIVDHVFTVEGLTGIQHIVISLHTVGDAVDYNLLQVIDHGTQIGVSLDGPVADRVLRPVADLVAPDFVPLISGGAAGVQVVQAGQIAGLLQDALKRGALGVIAQVLAHGGLADVAVAVDVHIDGGSFLVGQNGVKGDVDR